MIMNKMNYKEFGFYFVAGFVAVVFFAIAIWLFDEFYIG